MKKIISLFLSIILTLESLFISDFIAYSSFESTLFNVNNLGAPALSFKPGDRFSIDLKTTNTLSEAIKDVYVKIGFGNNAGFGYSGTDQRTRINSIQITNPVPNSAYDQANGLNFKITNDTVTQITAGQTFEMIRTSNTYTGFYVEPNISTYENLVSAWFEAKKVSDSSDVIGAASTKIFYVNVKPHVVDYYFEKGDGSQVTSQIQLANAETINLVAKVKDYNGCANIDGGIISADLSKIGLSNTETFNYQSCESDGKTAIFKKSGITTLAALGTYEFNGTHFRAADEDGNINALTDANTTFSAEDKQAADMKSLTVVAADAPQLNLVSLSDSIIGGPLKQSVNFIFSGNQDGEIKVTSGSDGSCNGGTTILDWTGMGSYTSGTSTGISIPSGSLAEGSNLIYGCVRNATMTIGSISTTVTKDSVAPIISELSGNKVSVVSENPIMSFKCSENGTFNVNIGGFDYLTGTTAGTDNIVTIPNADLADGSNTVNLYCRDLASNKTTSTWNITKSSEPPSMSGSMISFQDDDIDYDGLDGRDLSTSWDNSAATPYPYFDSYRLYLLPNNVAFNGLTHIPTAIISNKTTNTWRGGSNIKKDSTDTALVSGGIYKLCIGVFATNGRLGEAGCSDSAMIISDIVQHPVITSARFTSDTTLELTANSNLFPAAGAHSGSMITFQKGGITYTGTSVNSVNGNKIDIIIPSLNNLSASGINLTIQTGSIRSASGGFNDYFMSGGLQITDGQAPTIIGFSTGSISAYSNFYSGSLVFSYTLGESMKGGGATCVRFARTGGNASADKNYCITDPSKLTPGAKSITIDLSAIPLVSGTTYSAQLIGSDISLNQGSSSTINGIRFDNVGPAMMTINPVGAALGFTDPTLRWLSTTDDSGNGSGIGGYSLKIFTGTTCNSGYTLQNISDPLTLQYQTLLADMNGYSWNITPYDNMGNQGNPSNCDSFTINTTVPSILNLSVRNPSNNLINYAKDGNTIKVTANVSNSNSDNIFLDASYITGSGGLTDAKCSSPLSTDVTCTYVGGVVTYTIKVGYAATSGNGIKWMTLKARNTAGINDRSANVSVTADNTVPVITGSPISAPSAGTVWGGTSKDIIWNTSSITDNMGLAYLKFEYSSDNGSSWNLISTGSNTSPLSWNIGALTDGAQYKLKITAYDQVQNSASTVSDTFMIDKVAPVVPTNSIINPNGGNILKGGSSVNIIWNSGSITDNLPPLPATPIKLEYTADNGSSWILISDDLSNDGNHPWTVPNINSAQMKIRLTAKDKAGNTSNDISDSVFIADSTPPSMDVAFAGNGGNTPVNGKYINGTGLDITASATDSYLDKVYYTFQNVSDNQYWMQALSGWSALNWNAICSDGTVSGTNTNCTNFSQSINPAPIEDGKTYRLMFKAVDEAGNEKSYNPVDYIGDTASPLLAITNSSGSYFSGTVAISGTASDTGSNLSTTNIEIKKGSEWWNGNSWIGSQQILVTTGSAANWSYAFNPIPDNDGTTYVINAISYDQAYKTPNSTTKTISITKDVLAPDINLNDFWIHPTSATGTEIYRGGDTYTLSWNPSKIVDSRSGLGANPLKLEYFDGSTYQVLTGATANDGNHTFSLPALDITSSFRLTAMDNLGNSTGTISPDFIIDSTPPAITKIETVGDTTGKLSSFIVYFSEITNIPANSYSDFSTSIGSIASMDLPVSTSTGTSVKINLATPAGTTSSTPTISYISGAGKITDRAGNILATANNKVASDKAGPIMQKVEGFDSDLNGRLDKLTVTFSENLGTSSILDGFQLGNAFIGMDLSSASTSGNTMNILLTESASADTTTTGLDLSLNNSIYNDANGNPAGNFSNEDISDKASPVIISMETSGNRQVSSVRLAFSESLTGTLDSFALDGFGTGAYSGNINRNENILELNLDPTGITTSQTGTISYASGLRDNNSNPLITFAGYVISDKVDPAIISAETEDIDGNGKIDRIKMTASEDLNSDISGMTAEANSGSYSVSGISTSGKIIHIDVNEKPVEDTGLKPNIRIVTNGSLRDLAGNLITDTDVHQTSDKVGPVVIGARENGTSLYMNFSESISGADVGDFVLSGSNLPGIVSVDVSGNQATIILSAGLSGSADISFKTDAVADLLGNKQSTQHFVRISTSVIINEVMFSSGSNQYIELRNLGGSSVSLSGWTISNAGITIPGGASIGANGYYLIAKTGINILSGVTANLNGPLSLNQVSQADLVLIDSVGTINDKVLANPWPAGDGMSGIAIERKANAGDGLNQKSWYSSVVSVGLTSPSLKGTPKSSNVFDATSPTITSISPANNRLYPLGDVTIVIRYEDNVEIDPASGTLSLDKCTGTCIEVATGSISSSSITSTGAVFVTDGLPYGKYVANFSIADTSGNTRSAAITFYVDQVSMDISASGIDIGTISEDNTYFAPQDIVITIKTLGAGMKLEVGGDKIMNGPGGGIASYSSQEDLGFGFDYAETGSGNTRIFDGTLKAVDDILVSSRDLDPEALDGTLKTYVYNIRYGVRIDELQAAGSYESISRFNLRLEY